VGGPQPEEQSATFDGGSTTQKQDSPIGNCCSPTRGGDDVPSPGGKKSVGRDSPRSPKDKKRMRRAERNPYRPGKRQEAIVREGYQ